MKDRWGNLASFPIGEESLNGRVTDIQRENDKGEWVKRATISDRNIFVLKSQSTI